MKKSEEARKCVSAESGKGTPAHDDTQAAETRTEQEPGAGKPQPKDREEFRTKDNEEPPAADSGILRAKNDEASRTKDNEVSPVADSGILRARNDEASQTKDNEESPAADSGILRAKNDEASQTKDNEESPAADSGKPRAEGNEELRSDGASLRERLRSRKRSVMRQIEYRRLKRIRKRSVPAYAHCKNCGEKLQGMYCHRCGQYALDIEQPFWKYIRQYFENVYQFDGKIGQTLYLLFRRPGFLTQEFNAGKINSYVHPFRLYMCVSVVFFTIFFMIASSRLDKGLLQPGPRYLPDTMLAQLKNPEIRPDTAAFLYDVRGLRRFLKEKGVPADSLLRAIPLDDMRGLARVEMPRRLLDSCLYPTMLRDDDREWIKLLQSKGFAQKGLDREELAALEAVKEFRPGETLVYDWRKVGNETERLRAEHFVTALMARISKWTPFFMLFMLPVFALLTRWVYRKKRLRYMQHFVQAIHINTVFLLLLALPMGVLFASASREQIPGSAEGLCVGLFYLFMLGYMVVSFHRVYGLGWVRTAFKTLEVFCIFTLLAAGTAAAALLWLILRLADSM